MNAAYRIPERYSSATGESLAQEIGTGVLLHGPVGTGKSHRAAELMRTWVAAHLFDEGVKSAAMPMWVNVPRWLYDTRRSWRNPSVVVPTPDQMLVPRLLVLDDIGVEKPTDWALETLYVLVSCAYDSASTALIVTSNLAPAALADRIGARLVDRLVEMCAIVEVTGPSRRVEKRRNA